jgi:hypothetical protein
MGLSFEPEIYFKALSATEARSEYILFSIHRQKASLCGHIILRCGYIILRCGFVILCCGYIILPCGDVIPQCF